MSSFGFRRNEIIVAFGGSICWGLIFVGAATLVNKQTHSLEDEILSVEAQIARAQEMVNKKDAVAGAARELGLFDREEENDRAGSLMKLISDHAKNASVDVKILRPLGSADPKAVTLSGQGSWNDFVTFLSVLQSKPHYVDVEELRIMKTASYSHILSIEVTLARPAL